MSRFVRWRVCVLVIIVFWLALFSGCSRDKTDQYVQHRLARIHINSLPLHLNKNSIAAKTYIYWKTAEEDVDICMDIAQLDTDGVSVGERSFVGPNVINALAQIPTTGVDPEAVRAVSTILESVNRMRAINRDTIAAGALFGATLGGAKTDIDGEESDILDLFRAPDKLIRRTDAELTAISKNLQKKYVVSFSMPNFESDSGRGYAVCSSPAPQN